MIRDTSRAAYVDISERGVLQDQERQIMLWCHLLPPNAKFLRKEIGKALNMQNSTVSARVNRLVKLGYLEELAEVKDKGHLLRISGVQRELELAA